MTLSVPTGLHPEDYYRIEAAVMETVRGRWFLLEYARRQRAAETERLVQAIDRLERYTAARASAFEAADAPAEEVDPARAREIAEKARRFADVLSGRGVDAELCAQAAELADEIANLAGAPAVATTEDEDAQEIEASSFELEEFSEAGPLQIEPPSFEPEPEIFTPAEIAAVDPRLAALSRLDHLSLNEKLVLFG